MAETFSSLVIPGTLPLESIVPSSSNNNNVSVKIEPNGLDLQTDRDGNSSEELLQIRMPGKLTSSLNTKKKCQMVRLEPSDQKRYIPTVNDPVIGIVNYRGMDFFRVDIGAAHPAILPALSFENATKRNKPNLQVGSLVYARVVSASRLTETVLACTSVQGKADGFGELRDGTLISITSRLSHQ